MEDQESTPIIDLRKEDCFTYLGDEFIVLTRWLKKTGYMIAVDIKSRETKFNDPNLMVEKY